MLFQDHIATCKDVTVGIWQKEGCGFVSGALLSISTVNSDLVIVPTK